MHLVGYLYEDYHDARSLEHKVHVNSFAARHELIVLIETTLPSETAVISL